MPFEAVTTHDVSRARFLLEQVANALLDQDPQMRDDDTLFLDMLDGEGGDALDRHRQLVGLRSRWCAIRTACSEPRQSGDAGDLGPNLKGLDLGGSILDGWNLVAAELEEVADPAVCGQEALSLAC